MRFRLDFLLSAGCIILAVFTLRQAAYGACRSYDDVITNGSVGVADINGKVLDSCNIDTPLIPASIIKISTALVAMEILGPEYRFKTDLYQDQERNLYVKGYGDPQLVSEEVALIAAELKAQGIKAINGLYIDDSAFALEWQTPGAGYSSNPYDAPIGPVSVNFNSVSITVGEKFRVNSGERQTPLLPLMVELGKGKTTGNHRVNICRGGCNAASQIARYTAELFDAQFRHVGIVRTGPTGIRLVPKENELLLSHENSKSLEVILGAMLQYSSNFIANLVYLTCGAQQYGYPATWRKARQAVHLQLRSMLGEEAARQVHQVEGSGLARDSRVTGRVMLKILHLFGPHAYLLNSRRGVTVKTGTLKGVYNYAGYLPDGKPYVILLNQIKNNRTTVLDRLKKSISTARDPS